MECNLAEILEWLCVVFMCNPHGQSAKFYPRTNSHLGHDYLLIVY